MPAAFGAEVGPGPRAGHTVTSRRVVGFAVFVPLNPASRAADEPRPSSSSPELPAGGTRKQGTNAETRLGPARRCLASVRPSERRPLGRDGAGAPRRAPRSAVRMRRRRGATRAAFAHYCPCRRMDARGAPVTAHAAQATP